MGIWKIEETEEFFKGNVPQHRDVTHPHKRLQHLAGRFLLQFLFPDFPYGLIQIADTRKPFLPGEEYHFSISHCGDFAAAIVSRNSRVGIDIEIPAEKIIRVQDKFLSAAEKEIFLPEPEPAGYTVPTILWSSKEAVFKWYGDGEVDFKKHIRLEKNHKNPGVLHCTFSKTNQQLVIHFQQFNQLVLSWIIN